MTASTEGGINIEGVAEPTKGLTNFVSAINPTQIPSGVAALMKEPETTGIENSTTVADPGLGALEQRAAQMAIPVNAPERQTEGQVMPALAIPVGNETVADDELTKLRNENAGLKREKLELENQATYVEGYKNTLTRLANNTVAQTVLNAMDQGRSAEDALKAAAIIGGVNIETPKAAIVEDKDEELIPFPAGMTADDPQYADIQMKNQAIMIRNANLPLLRQLKTFEQRNQALEQKLNTITQTTEQQAQAQQRYDSNRKTNNVALSEAMKASGVDRAALNAAQEKMLGDELEVQLRPMGFSMNDAGRKLVSKVEFQYAIEHALATINRTAPPNLERPKPEGRGALSPTPGSLTPRVEPGPTKTVMPGREKDWSSAAMNAFGG